LNGPKFPLSSGRGFDLICTRLPGRLWAVRHRACQRDAGRGRQRSRSRTLAVALT